MSKIIIAGNVSQAFKDKLKAKLEADMARAMGPVDKPGIFASHRCWKCNDGERPCQDYAAKGNPNLCEYPRARND